MPYIGRDLNRGNYLKLDDISSSFNSSTTTFNLTVGGSAFRPGSAFSILVSVGGVIQEPESAYQVNNSEITFANAPTAQDSFFCIALGVALGIGVPGNGTVNGTQMAKPFNYDGFFYLDDANNRVGIGSLQPKQALDVIGNANISGILTASSFSGGSGGINAGVVTCTGLDVNGNGDISGNLVLGGDLTVNGTTTTLDTNLIGVDRIEVGANSSTVVGVAVTQSGTADLVRLYDGASQVVTIDDTGNVGLGSATPASLLNLASSNPLIRLTDTDSGSYSTIGGDGGNLYLYTNSTGRDFIFRGTSEVARITGDGKLGIGTHTPSKQLSIYGDSDTCIRVTSSAGGAASLQLGDTSDTVKGAITFLNSDNSLRIRGHNNDDRIIITSDGRIGINDGTPNDYELDILKRSTATDANIRLYNNATGSSNDTIMRYHIAGTTASNYIYFGDGDDSNVGQIRYQHSNDTMQFFTGANERFRISSNSLQFDSTAQQIHLSTADGSDNGFLNIGAAGGANNQNRGAQAVFYGNEHSTYRGQLGLLAGNSGNANGYIYFNTGGDERLRIATDGQILHGTDAHGGPYDGVTPAFVSEKVSGYHAFALVVNSTNSGHSGILQFVRSRGNSDGGNTIVQDGDRLGSIYGIGADGTDRNSSGAAIDFRVDGTPGTNDMPGRIEFRTTAVGAAVPSERLRITSAGLIRMGNGAAANTEASITAAIFQNVSGTATVLKLGNTNTPSSANNRAIEFCDGTGGTEGSSKYTYARIKAERAGGSNSGRLILSTKPNNSDGPQKAIEITPDGDVLIGNGGVTTQEGDGRLIVYANTRLHPAIKADCIDGGVNRANGFTMLADNYGADESITNIGISYSYAGLVLSRGVKVSNAADNVYLSSTDTSAQKPTAFKLDSGGNFTFLNTDTSATTTTDSTVTLYERFRIDSSGNVSINSIVGSAVYGNGLGQLRVINNAASTPASLSLFGYGNTTTGDNFAVIQFAQQENGTLGQVTAEIKALAVGTDERGTDLTFTTRPNTSSSSAAERLRITSDGQVRIGNPNNLALWGQNNRLQVAGNTWSSSGITIANMGSTSSSNLVMGNSRASTPGGSGGTLLANDRLGYMTFVGDDGTDMHTVGAAIVSSLDSNASSNSMPGRLTFYTGGNSNERLRIKSNGHVIIGNVSNTSGNTNSALHIESTGMNVESSYDTDDNQGSPPHLTLSGQSTRVRLDMGTLSVAPYAGWIQARFDNDPFATGTSNSGFEPLLLNPRGGTLGINVHDGDALANIGGGSASTYGGVVIRAGRAVNPTVNNASTAIKIFPGEVRAYQGTGAIGEQNQGTKYGGIAWNVLDPHNGSWGANYGGHHCWMGMSIHSVPGQEKSNWQVQMNNNAGQGTFADIVAIQANPEGYVTTPNQPSFCAVKNSSHFNFSSGSTTAISGWTEKHDTHSDFNPSTGVFTAPIQGTYYFYASVMQDRNDSGDFQLSIWVNSTLYVRSNDLTTGNVTYQQTTVPCIVNLAKNDEVTFRVYNSSGTSSYIYKNNYTHCGGYLIG